MIAKRLLSVCENEGLETDERALSLLVEMTGGDIRSCMNVLQVCIIIMVLVEAKYLFAKIYSLFKAEAAFLHETW